MKNRNHGFSSLDYQPQILPTFVSREHSTLERSSGWCPLLSSYKLKATRCLELFFFFNNAACLECRGWEKTLKREGQVIILASDSLPFLLVYGSYSEKPS